MPRSTSESGTRWPNPEWVTYATGRRVSVRLLAETPGPTGGTGYRDVVGVLEKGASDGWTIRRRDGRVSVVDPASVVAAKVVPDAGPHLRSASDIDVASLEVIAADGWQPLEQGTLGDWLLRAAGGFTGRANSVLPIGDPGVSLDDALDTVCSWYLSRGLTPMFQMPLPLRADLDAALTERGWDHHNRTQVMVCDLDQLRMATERAHSDSAAVTTSERPDADWLVAFRYRGQPLRPDVQPILTINEHPVFVTIRGADHQVRAIGRGAITGQWLGLTAVEVNGAFRRQGLAHRVIAALADHAAVHGARHVYLQVAHGNDGAVALYRRLGFEHHHEYVYRRSNPR